MSFKEASEGLAYYRTDPVGYITDVMGVTEQHWQAVASRVLADPETLRFSIGACFGPGKTCWGALTILWFLSCFYPARIMCTAPSGHQLYDKLWKEIATWMHKSKFDFNEVFEWQAHSIVLREAPQLHFASARVSRISETTAGPQAFSLQGTHAPHVMFFIEEASGVHDTIFDVGEGVLSTESETKKLVAIGNMNHPTGRFCQTFSSPLWRSMRVDYTKTKQVSSAWAEELIARLGRDNAYIRVAILALPPLSSKDGLATMQELAMAAGKEKQEDVISKYSHAQKVLGVDVAGEGENKTIITRAKGLATFGSKKFQRMKNDDLAHEVVNEAVDYGATNIIIDADGIGSILCQTVEDLIQKRNIKQVFVTRWHGNSSPINDSAYGNARAELGCVFAIALQRGLVSLAPDKELDSQAVTIKTYRRRGLEWLESKKELSARLKKLHGASSCDELDSALYALSPALRELSADILREEAMARTQQQCTPSRREKLQQRIIA